MTKKVSGRHKTQSQEILAQSFTDLTPISESGRLVDHFLVAAPALEDSVFGGTVIYIWDHDSDGALGLIINRSTDLTVGDLAARLQIKVENNDKSTEHAHVFFGGPVQAERGVVLHEPVRDQAFLSTQTIGDKLCLTSTFDVLESALKGNGPNNWMVALGYAGWTAGQLEEEIANDNWLIVSANHQLLFSTPPPLRYAAALKLLGVNVFQLTNQTGHA